MTLHYCSRCLYHEEHALGLIIDDQGLCSGCRVHEEKDQIDWSAREKELQLLVEAFKNHNQKNYDCIVPVSGGKDSYFIVDYVKNKLSLNPLLVSYNKHYNSSVGIANLAYLRTKLDCDYMAMVVDPAKVKKITRATLKHFGSIYWHCIAGETVFPVQVAVKMRIPLIIWGAHQGLDQVGMYSHLDNVEMTRRYRKNHDLMGYEAEDLLSLDEGLSIDDINPFIYPDENEISAVGVRGIYLGNYVRWDSKQQHDQMIEKYKYETAQQARTFDPYNHPDCIHYSSLHDYIKLVKYGYSKVVDHAVREIRLGRISRGEGLELVKKYISRFELHDLDAFSEWVCMSKAEIMRHIHRFCHRSFWTEDAEGKFHFNLGKAIEKSNSDMQMKTNLLLNREFTVNTHINPCSQCYTLIGKGYRLEHGYYQDV